MAVYVDEIVNHGPKKGRWCHMMADTLDELHAMADKIGMKRQWFQDKSHYPHYDLRATRRQLAINNGAIECTSVDLIHKFSPFFRRAQ